MPYVLGAVALVAILLVWWLWDWLSGWTPPGRAEAEAQIVASVGESDKVTAAAVCGEPTEGGVSCLLRDGHGRYGSSTTVYTAAPGEKSGRMASSTWGFPVAADGVMVRDLLVTPPSSLETELARAVGAGAAALGESLLSPNTKVHCPEPGLGSCTTSGLAKAAVLQRLDTGRYQVTVTFTVPPEAAVRPLPR